jgi:hypothetical protein
MISQNKSYQKQQGETKTTATIKKITKKIDASEIKYKKREKDWYIFVSSYLKIAENSCKLLEKRLTQEGKFIIIAIVYNLKHALENIIKAFNRTINKDIDKSDQIHDIKKLFKGFEKSAKGKGSEKLKKQLKSLESLVIKYYELSFLSDYTKNCFTINDCENTFLKYPENSAQLVVDYEKLFAQISKEDIRNIEKDIKKIIKITSDIKNLIK